MKLAIISDIHANLEALTRALKMIETMRIDEIVCLGDIIGYGADPDQCVRLIREHCRIVILGNHDAAAIDPDVARSFNPSAYESANWTRTQLTDDTLAYISALPMTQTLNGCFFVHASPFEPKEWNYLVTALDAADAFPCFNEQTCFVGHSHIPKVFSESRAIFASQKNPRRIFNVGSVGQPRDGDPRLSFGVFDTLDGSYQNIRKEYDNKTAASKIIDAGLPTRLGRRLLIGQ